MNKHGTQPINTIENMMHKMQLEYDSSNTQLIQYKHKHTNIYP